MDLVIALIVFLAATAVVLVWFGIEWRRRRSTTRDDLVRVGDEVEVDPRTATFRAQGKAAWTRMSGGV
ncbi:hypothetical protein ACFQ0P_03830 [Microbacterium insulae]|uniref:Uncharacterized protein n=1 Tax=Microbacterium insulae TaxID=483014 RepID=A0ABW3AF55_9MICO